MHILYVTPYSPKEISGVANVVLSLMQGMRERGHESTYLTVGKGGVAPDDIDLEEIPFHGPRFVRTVTARRHLKRWLRGNIEKYDVIHAHSPTWLALDVIMEGKKRGIPSCLTLHGKYPLTGSLYHSVFRRIGERTIRSVDKVFSVDGGSLDFWNVGNGKIVRNGIDTAHFRPDSDVRKRMREEIGIAEGSLVFLYLARWEEHKGLFETIDAVDEMSGGEVDLLICGSPGSFDPRKRLRTSKNPGRFHLIGKVSSTVEYFQMSDIYLLYTSPLEGLPLSLLEAMSVGVVPVSTDVSGISDVVSNGNNGFLCKYGDSAAFRGVLKNLHAADLESISRGARATVKERFSLESMIQTYLEEYQRLEPSK